MSKVKVVDSELLGPGVAFPSLKFLSFDDMREWEVWSTNGGAFPCLKELHIVRCPNLVTVSLELLHSLMFLKLSGCGHGVLKSLVDVASCVIKLEVDDISGLTDERWRGVMVHLGEVRDVSISVCNEIRYLWESKAEASKVLVKLGKLAVRECENLVSLGKKEEDNSRNDLKSLWSLDVSNCNSLEHCSCPDSIRYLSIQHCDSITSISFPTRRGKKLKSFDISDCKKLLAKELGEGENTGLLISSSMRKLDTILISYQPNLKSITALSYFIHLKKLRIMECPSIESFPDHELSNLTFLIYIWIYECVLVWTRASFPRGLWPPKLEFLAIGGLKKPISQWGPQNFPTSLVELRLYGAPYDDVSNFDQLSYLLPSSLLYLRIHHFEKLESVSRGLQHLTSLQYLNISECPKVIDLPDMLLPSLKYLGINGCPNLEEKISSGGSYWSLISLIPCYNDYKNSQV